MMDGTEPPLAVGPLVRSAATGCRYPNASLRCAAVLQTLLRVALHSPLPTYLESTRRLSQPRKPHYCHSAGAANRNVTPTYQTREEEFIPCPRSTARTRQRKVRAGPEPIVNLNATIAVAASARTPGSFGDPRCSIDCAGLAANIVQIRMRQNTQQRAQAVPRMRSSGN